MTAIAPDAHALKPHLTREHLLRRLRQMIRVRRFEERCVELYQQEKIRGFLHVYIGEEAVAVGTLETIEAADTVVATYREHGHAIVRGVPMDAVMAEMYGKAEGGCRGRGGAMHLGGAGPRVCGGNAIVAGGLPLAVGLALADKMAGRHQATACFFGDGAVAEGEFHESLNLAQLWRLPVLFICENNLYAMGTSLERAQSQTDIHLKAQSYNVPAEVVDGMDVVAVEAAGRQAAAFVRSGQGPYFLECRTYRFRAHSMFDPQLYRDKAEVEAWKKHDPIDRLGGWLRETGMLHDIDLLAIESDTAVEIDRSVAFAEAGHWEPVEQLTRHVYTERTVL
jgi:pyruvate dehydrogenase E1 component alpha subunit